MRRVRLRSVLGCVLLLSGSLLFHAGCGDDSPSKPPGTTDIEGRVWLYRPSPTTDFLYTWSWGSNVNVATAGLQKEISTRTNWEGRFALPKVPVGETIYLRASGIEGATNGCSQVFTVEKDQLILLVMATDALVTAMAEAWGVAIDPQQALLCAVAANWDPNQDPPITAFIGGVTVSLTPEVQEQDFKLVYFDPTNVSNTARTSTHPAQSLIFGANVPVSSTQKSTYTLSAQHATHQFENIKLPAEANTLTHVVIAPR